MTTPTPPQDAQGGNTTGNTTDTPTGDTPTGVHPLAALGWRDGFEHLDGGAAPGEVVARVAAVDRELLWLIDDAGSFRAALAGSYRHRHPLPHEQPCVGDWVVAERPAADGTGRVERLLPRHSALRRKSAGSAVEHQMIAANVDRVLVVQSCQHDFNLKRLERYLVMVHDGGAEAMVLLTKTDLVPAEVLAAQRAQIRAAGISAPVLALNLLAPDGLDALLATLAPGSTCCVVGSSGVGKSTLINRLLGRERLATQGVSGTGEGRHTTVRRELVVLEGGALVIDTPGMREFGILGADTGLAGHYGDLLAHAARCRFRDCSHTDEPGCAVRAAVAQGEAGHAHYDNFLKLRKESEFHERSALERRRKDRDFGKFLKTVKKDLAR